MRLLLLFPNFILTAVAGYNLFLDFNGHSANSNYLVHSILHAVVLIMSLVFIGVLLKPIFPAYTPNYSFNKIIKRYFTPAK